MSELENGSEIDPLDTVEIDDEKSEDKGKKYSTTLRWLGFREEIVNESDDCHIPDISYLEIFKIFLWFGCRAFGGPVSQISLMKEELVVDQKWITVDKFNRVYAVYQILPGPEATELACYFGYLAKGRIGALLGGIGFLAPGVLCLLLFSYLYVTYGVSDPRVQASFRGVQIAVAAIIFRATFKLADSAILNKDKSFNWDRGFLCLFNFLVGSIMVFINHRITKPHPTFLYLQIIRHQQ